MGRSSSGGNDYGDAAQPTQPVARFDPRDIELAKALERTADGDRNAFRKVYELSSSRLYGLALRVLKDPAQAEDALQDAYIKIWKNAWRFDADVGSPWAWLTVLVRRVAMDRRPRIMVQVELDELPAIAGDPDLIHPRTVEGLKALPEVQQKALVLAYVYGYSHSEIAETMQAPLGTVKSWVRRATETMREALERPTATETSAPV